jgi:hypothetical protein
VKSNKQPLFWVITVGAILGGAVLIAATILSQFYGHAIIRELARAIGEALFIAGFISVTVDQFVKGRLLKETSRDISKYLIGYNLPPEVQDRIHHLMGTTVIRRDFRQSYKLERIDGQLRATICGEYNIENCSNSEQEYTPGLHLEKHENPTMIEFRCDSADKNAVDRKIGGTQDSHDVVSFFLKTFKVQPVGSGLTYRVSYKFSRPVRDADSDLLAFNGPTIGVTITAECPDDLNFDAGDATIQTANRWEFKVLYIEGQHLHPRWFPKPSNQNSK